MRFPARLLAVLALVAGLAFGVAYVAERPSRCDAAEGVVAVTAIVRASHPPPLGLSAVAEGYTIAINWINPAQPYNGTLIEWFTQGVRFGTDEGLTWHQYEMHYPPATWAHVSAPMGARYTVQGSSYYDGGAAISVPSTASVVMTSPVEISSWCPTSGYATSPALRQRFGDASYAARFESQLQVPGGTRNLSMSPNPVSWSAQLTGSPTIEVYRLRLVTHARRGSPPRRARYWTLSSTGNPSFADGYPALCSYSLTSTVPGTYKLVMRGEFVEGFSHHEVRTWKATRYIALAATRFTPKLTTPKISGTPRRTKKVVCSGALTVNPSAMLHLSFQRLTRAGWRSFKVARVRSTAKGLWVARTSIRRTGRYRVRAAVASRVVSRYREYAAARSEWRRFNVR